jgi:hypothetical protein
MGKHVVFSLSCLLIAGMIFIASCGKSGSPANTVNKADLTGTWANTYFIVAKTSPFVTIPITNNADTFQFDGSGKLYATYYSKIYSPAVDSAVWTKQADTATYTFVNDTTLYINGRTFAYFAYASSDTFRIRTLNAHELNLYSPDPAGGGYSYFFSK